MYLGDPNITKKGLLALKDSKPVPITAHSHEIVVPCIYTETVKKMMKQKGIELPLTPAKLAEARKLAKKTPGKYEADPEEKAGGSSHAKGTTNIQANQQAVQVKNVIHIGRSSRGRRKRRTPGVKGLIQVPVSAPLITQPAYNLVRPFAANTPIGFQPVPIPSKEDAKRELEKEEIREKRLATLESLVKETAEREKREQQHIKQQMVPSDSYRIPQSDRDKQISQAMGDRRRAALSDVMARADASREEALKKASAPPSASDVSKRLKEALEK
jgi:hypothetical protein